MDELAQFLRDRLATEEQVAREATAGPWRNAPTARHHATASGRPEEAVFAAPPETGAVVVATTGEAIERRNLVNAEHIARHDPARVLRDIEAKRGIVDDLAEEIRWGERKGPDYQDGAKSCERTLKRLALAYADHPAYRAEWRP